MPKEIAVAITAMLALVLLQTNVANAATILVGGSENGWNFQVINWSGKTFNTGDTLVFQYNPAAHNVVIVDQASYDACTVPADAPTFRTGNDSITLAEGVNYYICGVPGHCAAGLQLNVTGA